MQYPDLLGVDELIFGRMPSIFSAELCMNDVWILMPVVNAHPQLELEVSMGLNETALTVMHVPF